jgi:hypothetical protein
MDYLYKHKEMFDTKKIQLIRGLPNTAVIIEPRNTESEMLELVVKNFMYYLHKDWSLMIIHGTENADLVDELCKSIGEVYLVKLNVSNLSMRQYNQLSVSSDLYNIIPTENILMFQTDTILRKPIPEELLNYAYVGAPWKLGLPWSEATGGIGNGGLSLRKKSAMLHIIQYYNHPHKGIMNEDIYFSMACQHLKMNRPSYDLAKTFSIETVFHPDPIGIHKPHFSEDDCREMLSISHFPSLSEMMI